MARFNNLEDIARTAWNLLYRATVERNNAFRTPIFTTSRAGMPNARTLVLREVNVQERQLLFYTDYRSPKVQELQASPNVCLVFWSSNRNVQIRAYGRTTIEYQNDVAKAYWEKIAPKNRRDYSTLISPSTSISAEEAYLPNFWQQQDITTQQTDYAFRHFALLSVLVEELDILHLHRAGHQRAKLYWKNEQWQKTWLVP
ncbi:MAG: pyridoxamine 5'-phosphate oxidase family protein [Bacteroidota bacterium]